MESFFVQMDYGFIFHKKCLPDLYTFPDFIFMPQKRCFSIYTFTSKRAREVFLPRSAARPITAYTRT